MRTHGSYSGPYWDMGILFLPTVERVAHSVLMQASDLTQAVVDVSDAGRIVGFEFLGARGLASRYVAKFGRAPRSDRPGNAGGRWATIDIDLEYSPLDDRLRVILDEEAEIVSTNLASDWPNAALTFELDALGLVAAIAIGNASHTIPADVMAQARVANADNA